MVCIDGKGNVILPESKDNGKMRTFGSGAVRDTSVDKLDYEACLSPLVLKRYAEYVKSCRVQPDGNIRADDNWQKGFGLSVWMKSKWRHLITTWRCYRDPSYGDIEKSLCAEFFNTHGMLHEILVNKMVGNAPQLQIPNDLSLTQIAILKVDTRMGVRLHYENCDSMEAAFERVAKLRHTNSSDMFTVEVSGGIT